MTQRLIMKATVLGLIPTHGNDFSLSSRSDKFRERRVRGERGALTLDSLCLS